MLCTSGFVDDVWITLHIAANGAESKTTLCFVKFAKSELSTIALFVKVW